MKIKYFQKGFNYSQDGRGNRLIYHLQGCNMKCPWCANPEGMRPKGVLMTDPEWLRESCCPRGAVRKLKEADVSTSRQAGCESVQEAQSVQDTQTALTKETAQNAQVASSKYLLDRDMCTACADRPCINGMRQKGLRWSCTEQETGEIVQECVRSRPMFFDGGGVTLTGGEMSLQFEAVRELLGMLGEAGIHRTVETNGSHPRAAELFPLVDEWIMDFKHWDSEKHKAWLGIGNERIIETCRAACESHPDVLIRIPMMPDFNDSREDADAFAALLAPYASRENVRMEVLTYHEFGKGKWAQCGMDYTMKDGRIAPEQRAYLEEKLRQAGIRVVRT